MLVQCCDFRKGEVMNTSVSSQNWLSSIKNLTIKNCLPHMEAATYTIAVPPFRMVDVPLNHGENASETATFTREDFFNALARAADPWEHQMVRDVESGAIDKLIADINATEDGELEEL